MVKASPLLLSRVTNDNVTSYLDGSLVQQRRDQAIGEEKGLRYLKNYITLTEADLRQKVKEQEQPKTQG